MWAYNYPNSNNGDVFGFNEKNTIHAWYNYRVIMQWSVRF